MKAIAAKMSSRPRQNCFDATASTARARGTLPVPSACIPDHFFHFKSKDALLHEVIQEGMRSAMARQMIVLLAEHDAVTMLRLLIRSHFETILGSSSDFMHVVLYESRYLNATQHKIIANLQAEYKATWTSVLQELSLTGCLQVEVPVARHLLFGVLNGSAQWFKSEMGISIDDLTDAVVTLFIHVPAA